ncbi:hypothetical protein TOK_6263 [Pseudonocardia sp. N23]|nr:hypothetical protein TOK_6263 [Pseudonocardia sp. N23]
MLPRGLIVVLGLAAFVIIVAGLQGISSILAPTLLALVLVIGVHPLTGILRRRGAPMWLAVTATLVAVFAVVIGLAAAFALSVAELASLLPAYQDRFATLIADVTAWLQQLGVGPDQFRAALDGLSFGTLLGIVSDILAGLAGTLSNLLFLLFVVAFMGLDALHFSHRLEGLRGERNAVVAALGDFVHGTRSYLLVTTVFGLIVAVVDGALLWALGVPLPLLWALLAFVTNYIPNIGFVIGLLPPALLALLEGGPQLMIIVVVAYVIINFVIQSVIQPKFLSDAVNLSLTLTFLSLVFWSFAIGPLGAVLAIPLTLLAKALLLDADPDTRWISGLLSSGPAPEPPGPAPAVDDAPPALGADPDPDPADPDPAADRGPA